jgi:hypothetical protein
MHKISIITYVFSLLFINVTTLLAQNFSIDPPVKIPIFLSGNFGELRSSHFHAGIDIKTQGVTGHAIYTAAEGYVSRFKVQSGGYGHALYITHPNGYTSVYAHLDEFYPELEQFLREQQYLKKSFEVDVYPEKGKFRIDRGQQIGVSGNTGRSMGPHLHFEIRDRNQIPQNVLKHSLPVEDTIPPKFKKLVVYNNINSETLRYAGKEVLKVSSNSNNYSYSETVDLSGIGAFGVEVYDYLNGSNNRCGVYNLDFFLDDTLVFSFTVEGISFGETRYIKSHLDYAEKKLNKRNVHKLFREPNNKLSIYNEIKNHGLINISDSLIHQAKIIASDVYGNTSTLSFSLTGHSYSTPRKADTGVVFISFDKEAFYKNEVFAITIPANGLYSNNWLSYFVLPANGNYFSDIHMVGDEFVPVNEYPELAMKVTKPLNNMPVEKLVIAKLEDDGSMSSEGGVYNDGFLETKISEFGKYVIAADTLPPTIQQVSFKEGGWYAAKDKISFKITDDISGIKTYNGYIDGDWALFEYDAKSDNLFYRIDLERLQRSKGKHEIKLFVLDERNNLQTFESFFYF